MSIAGRRRSNSRHVISGGSTARRAYDFIDTIGVNTHISFAGNNNQNQTYLLADFAYLGIHHARDNTLPTGFTSFINQWIDLGNAGVKWCFSEGADPDAAKTVNCMLAVLAGSPGSVIACEGLNEADGSIAAANTAQANLFTAVNAQGGLNGVTILVWPLASSSNAAAQGNQNANSDAGNIHSYNYANVNNATYDYMTSQIASELTNVTPGRPIWVTEMGQNTASTSTDFAPFYFGVTPTVQAKLGLNQWCDNFLHGVVRSYWYDLIDDAVASGTADWANNFGMFDGNNNPKLLATALKSMVAIINDAGGTASSFTTTPIAYTVTNQPAAFRHFPLQKANGTYQIVMWAEPMFWTPGAPGSAATVSTTTVTLTFTNNWGAIHVYDPLIGTTAIANSSGPSVSVGITEHPIIVECVP